MIKRYLLAPGPTPVPPEVLLAMARPIIHHRAPEFDKLFAEVRDGLKWLFQTKSDVLMLAASGTGGMEGSVSNFLSPGDKALTINGGKFGERWGKLCKTFGAQVTELKVEWGRAVDPQAVADALKKDPQRQEIYLKLLEIHAQHNKPSAFETVASELYSVSGGQGEVWQKAMALGRQLDPNNPLFTEAGSAAAFAAAAGSEHPAPAPRDDRAKVRPGNPVLIPTTSVAGNRAPARSSAAG